MESPGDDHGDVKEGEWVYIDARPYRPMIGRVESKMPGFVMVHINVGSRYRKGRTIPIPEQMLQPHKVHRLQIQSVTGPLPELMQGQTTFPLFTDKPNKYPDFSHPDNKMDFSTPASAQPKQTLDDLFAQDDEPEMDSHHQTNQIGQAQKALGVPQTNPHPQDSYARTRDFLMGGRPSHAPAQPSRTRQGNLGY